MGNFFAIVNSMLPAMTLKLVYLANNMLLNSLLLKKISVMDFIVLFGIHVITFMMYCTFIDVYFLSKYENVSA